jgi:hypothetical protein
MVLRWLCNIYIHLKRLTVPHFGMAAATALKWWLRGHLQRYYFPTEFHKNLPIGSEVYGGKTHRQDADLISLLFSL